MFSIPLVRLKYYVNLGINVEIHADEKKIPHRITIEKCGSYNTRSGRTQSILVCFFSFFFFFFFASSIMFCIYFCWEKICKPWIKIHRTHTKPKKTNNNSLRFNLCIWFIQSSLWFDGTATTLASTILQNKIDPCGYYIERQRRYRRQWTSCIALYSILLKKNCVCFVTLLLLIINKSDKMRVVVPVNCCRSHNVFPTHRQTHCTLRMERKNTKIPYFLMARLGWDHFADSRP